MIEIVVATICINGSLVGCDRALQAYYHNTPSLHEFSRRMENQFRDYTFILTSGRVFYNRELLVPIITNISLSLTNKGVYLLYSNKF